MLQNTFTTIWSKKKSTNKNNKTKAKQTNNIIIHTYVYLYQHTNYTNGYISYNLLNYYYNNTEIEQTIVMNIL